MTIPPMSREGAAGARSLAASRLLRVTVSQGSIMSLPSVGVDDRHRLGAVNDEGAAGGKPPCDPALPASCSSMRCAWRRRVPLPLLDAVRVPGLSSSVFLDGLRTCYALSMTESAVVLVEDVAHRAPRAQARRAEHRSVLGRRTLLSVSSLAGVGRQRRRESAPQLHPRRRCAGDSGTGGDDGLEDLLQSAHTLRPSGGFRRFPSLEPPGMSTRVASRG